jgi:hypothetical protein
MVIDITCCGFGDGYESTCTDCNPGLWAVNISRG